MWLNYRVCVGKSSCGTAYTVASIHLYHILMQRRIASISAWGQPFPGHRWLAQTLKEIPLAVINMYWVESNVPTN